MIVLTRYSSPTLGRKGSPGSPFFRGSQAWDRPALRDMCPSTLLPGRSRKALPPVLTSHRGDLSGVARQLPVPVGDLTVAPVWVTAASDTTGHEEHVRRLGPGEADIGKQTRGHRQLEIVVNPRSDP